MPRMFQRKLVWSGAGLLAALIAIPSFVFSPYVMRVRHVPANPEAGFHADYFFYVSPKAARSAAEGKTVTILVQPNNSGTNSDDPSVHRKDAWWTGLGRKPIADELGVVLLVPAFVRPGQDWHIYSHAIDRDTLTTERPDLARLDLQLIAMIDHLRQTLARESVNASPKILIQGFSASGMFSNRFTALHPDRVLASASGSPGGWPIAPLSQIGGEPLPYPAGVADVESLTGNPFDTAAFNSVPQLFVLGSLDDNDSLDFRDGWDEAPAAQVDRLFGSDPQSRWKPAEEVYRTAGANAQFLLIEGIGHDRRALQQYTTDFFRKVLGE